jgi:thiamine-phosphate pyrophosphorylase
MTDKTQLYLISPPVIDLQVFPPLLATVLDAVPVGCLRLALASQDQDDILRAGDALREVAHARDVAIVIDSHLRLAGVLGLDGVHLTDAARSVRAARKEMGEDAIIGTFCGASRHDGMTAAEVGADYVAFGPVTDRGLGDGRLADPDLFQWWSEMIEVPVVAEGVGDEATMRALAPFADFVALAPDLWATPDPLARIRALHAAIG